MAHALIELLTAPIDYYDDRVQPNAYAVTGQDLQASLATASTPVGVNPTVVSPFTAKGALLGSYLYDYYYRIWVVPDALRLRNPRPLVDTPIYIWNAYPQPYAGNTLETFSNVGGVGIAWDLEAPSLFYPLEYRQVNFQVLPSAPNRVEATYHFNFELGDGYFFLTVDRASVVHMIPDAPITETWQFLTDVLVSDDGTEQRIGLRAAPRRTLEMSITVLNSAEWRTQFRRLFGDINSQLIFPYWQYNAALTEEALIGSTALAFQSRFTDLRVGEYLLVLNTVTSSNQLLKVTALTEDGCEVDTPLSYTFPVGSIVCPAMPSRVENRSGLAMYPVDAGHMRVKTSSLEPRQVHSRPGSTATVVTFDGYAVLDRRPLNNDLTDYTFDGNGSVLDMDTGVVEIKSTWPWPQVEGSREWQVHRVQDPNEMDWWRDFTAAVDGRRVPFLVPSFREDLALAEEPETGAGTLYFAGTEYVDMYFKHPGFTRIAVESAGGTYYRRIDSVRSVNGMSEAVLATPIPPGAEYASIQRVSFLMLCRFATDEIRLEHHQLDTIVEAGLRSVYG